MPIGHLLPLFDGAEAQSLKTVQLRTLITSRPEIPIRHGFGQIPKAEHRDFVLHNIETAIVDHDISLFLGHERRERVQTSPELNFHL
jgi:hypothetical protein